MSFDLSMFYSLFLDKQCEKDGNTAKKFLLHSSASTSKGLVCGAYSKFSIEVASYFLSFLSSIEAVSKGTVKLVFQPGEEGYAGAYHMLKESALDDVDAIIGLHVLLIVPTGSCQICFEPLTWSGDSTLSVKLILVRADISRLPFVSGSIDVVHASAALYCLPSPSSAVLFTTVEDMDNLFYTGSMAAIQQKEA